MHAIMETRVKIAEFRPVKGVLQSKWLELTDRKHSTNFMCYCFHDGTFQGFNETFLAYICVQGPYLDMVLFDISSLNFLYGKIF